jgi:hypothetical protein
MADKSALAALLDGWASLTALASLLLFSGLFVFQIVFFQYIGFGFLGLIGASDLLINMTIILPPIVCVVSGLVMEMDRYRDVLEAIVEIMHHRIARLIVTFVYLAIVTFYIFTDPLLGVLVIPSWTASTMLAIFITWQWIQSKTVVYYQVTMLVVLLALALLTTGFLSARHMICCSSVFYTVKTKDGILDHVKILRSSDAGIVYNSGDTISFIPKDQVITVSKPLREMEK